MEWHRTEGWACEGKGDEPAGEWRGLVGGGGTSALGRETGPTVAVWPVPLVPGAHARSSCASLLFGVRPVLPLLLCTPSNRT